MADKKQISKISSLIKQGKGSEAYRAYEELSFGDQILVAVSPVVGDFLAGYEIKEFSSRAAKNVEDKDYLGATGNLAIASLATLSLIPLFRWLRGSKGVAKAATEIATPRRGKAGLKGPGEYQAEQAAKKEAAEKAAEEKLIKASKKAAKEAEAAKKAELPAVKEFIPLSLDEMVYPGTKTKKLGLTSKAAKFINTSNKLPNQGKAIGYINALEKAGIPKGELRLLNILDEAGEIHPKLLSELEIRNPLGRITRQRLANYIKANQQNSIYKRMVAPGQEEAADRLIRNSDGILRNEKEISYHVRGIERGDDLGRHYGKPNQAEHKAHYAFDAAAEFVVPPVGGAFPTSVVKGGDKILNVGRIQSDYSRELGASASANKRKQLGFFRNDPRVEALADKFTSDNFEIINEVARANSGLSTEKLIAKFVKTVNSRQGADYSVQDFLQEDNFGFTKTVDDLRLVIKETTENFPVSPYIDGKAIAVLKKSLNEYNKIVPEVNKLSQDQVNLQNKITNSGLDINSPSLAEDMANLGEMQAKSRNLIPSSAVDDFSGFTLSKGDLEAATGKPFLESLDKSLDEIFYATDSQFGGPLVQKYGPGDPGERALNYFNQLVNNNEMTFDIGNGIRILKKATKINLDGFDGVPIDAYAKGTKTEMYKFPIRTRFVEAVSRGFDGMSIDSAAKRLGDEAPGDEANKFLQPFYDKDAPNEISKILKELGVDPTEYMGKVKETDNLPYSGTYVKIDDEIRRLVEEKGVDAFKAGGPASIQDQLNQLNETILPIDISSDVGSIKPNDFNSLLEETGISPVGSKGAESIILAMSIRAMNPLQKAQAIRASTAPVLKKLKSLHEQKQKYVENNSATQVNKYAERLNRYNRDIQLAEDKIKDISKMYDPKNYNAGGAVDESKLEQTERRLDAGEEIDDILKDLYGTAIANEFGEFDYKAPLNKFKDSIENSFSNYQDSIEKYLSNQFDFKYQDDLMDIYKSDDPGANIENRARKFSANSINSLLDDLNLPVDVSRSNYGTSFDKRINVAPNTNVTLDAYKSDDGDFTGDLNLRYSDRGKYGNIDLQSAINELGDTQDSIRYKQDIGPFSIKAGKTAGRDATGSVSYNLPSMSVGNAQTIQARVVVDSLLNAKGQLDYMYNNPNTGYFVDAGLGLNSQRSPEFNLKFGKNF